MSKSCLTTVDCSERKIEELVSLPSALACQGAGELMKTDERVGCMSRQQIANFGSCAGRVVSGQFAIMAVADRITQQGVPFRALHLGDSSGSMHAYIWESSGLLERTPMSSGSLVQLSMKLRFLNERLVGDVTSVHALEAGEIDNAAALLPFDHCPKTALPALNSLVDFVDHMRVPCLKEFLNRVLADENISRFLLSCKASMAHHHHECGGLLVHSMAVLNTVSAIAKQNGLSQQDACVAQVAALFHDLGKIRTVGSGNVRPVHWKLVRHESQTTRLLERHLAWLWNRSPSVAAGLDYIFDYIAQPKASRGIARFVGADLVVSADGISAAMDNKKCLDDLLHDVMPRHRELACGAAITW